MTLTLRSLYAFVVITLLLLTLHQPRACAQGEVRSIQFTGILTGGKNSEPLIGATIYIPRAGRGTITNNLGFFTIPVYPGDSIIFTYIGYKKQFHVIPHINELTYSRVIEMQEDATLLREVKVYPYPSEDDFKKAFMAMRLADEKERENLAKNTDPQYIKQLASQMGNGAAANYRYFLNQQTNYNTNRGFANTVPFLNPFAWASFIKSVKNGDFKRDDWKPAASTMPTQNVNRDQYIRQQQKQ